jgi:hypothetical protein
MSPKLRDKIRREAYITNEIIIQHEAQRVIKSTPNEITETERYVSELDTSNHWNRVLGNTLTPHDFDLEVHGSPMCPAVVTSSVGPVEL